MEFIKKYWWILAAAVLLMIMGKKKKTRRRSTRKPMSRMRRAGIRMATSMRYRRQNPLGGYRSYAGLSKRRRASRMRRR